MTISMAFLFSSFCHGCWYCHVHKHVYCFVHLFNDTYCLIDFRSPCKEPSAWCVYIRASADVLSSFGGLRVLEWRHLRRRDETEPGRFKIRMYACILLIISFVTVNIQVQYLPILSNYILYSPIDIYFVNKWNI